jgi:site-specific recombinase XerD
MIDDMQIRNLTPNTQRVYVAQVVRFACHFRKSPELLGPAEIRTYLIHLTQERRLAASSIIVTVSALRFFFTVTLKRPWIVEDDIPAGRQAKKLPVVLSQEEVARFLGAVDNLKHRVILTVCYATGLRISEAVRLKATAIDSKRMVIGVEQGKGRKDRYVMLPPKLLDILSPLTPNSCHFAHQKIPSSHHRNDNGVLDPAGDGGGRPARLRQVIPIRPFDPFDHSDVA